jgi:CheY-like chemotaxis protein/anti-sigma regulatory factor (Ser/Thr protein kinase)
MTKILVVEDSKEVRNNISQLLSIKGYDVDVAENGKIGLEKVNKYMPDLIISDIMMPEMDGHVFFNELRKCPKTELIPFIFLTAKASPEAIRQGMRVGADDYLVKPFRAKDLFDAVEARLDKKTKWQSKITNITSHLSEYVPHELRTPLVGIIGFTDILIDEFNSLDNADKLDMLKMIKNSSKILYKTIEKFILYSDVVLKLSGEKQTIHNNGSDKFNIKETISKVVKEYLETEKRPCDVKLNLCDAEIRMDREYFVFIIEEILANAVKFSPKGKPVEIVNEILNDKTIIKITDHGRGMTPEEINSIEPFVQHQRKLFEQPGIGLGLPVVSKLISLFGGEMKIESVRNNYTTVSLKFSLAVN